MNSQAHFLSHDLDGCRLHNVAGRNKGSGWDDHREDRDQLTISSDAVVDADTSASRIFDLSNFTNEKLGHTVRVQYFGHSNSPHCNGEHQITYVKFCTQNRTTQFVNRFRAAACTNTAHNCTTASKTDHTHPHLPRFVAGQATAVVVRKATAFSSACNSQAEASSAAEILPRSHVADEVIHSRSEA